MNKAEHKFHRDKKEQIENLSKENEPLIWQMWKPSHKPIFIPKHKKKK